MLEGRFTPSRRSTIIWRTLLLTIKRGHLGNVTTHQLALSDQAGKARMSIPSVVEHSLGTFTETGQDVVVATIDGLIECGVPPPSFIKCDVEGNAPKVVAGAIELIRAKRPAWLMEVWSNEEIQHMESIGYDCYRYPVRGGSIH